MLEAEVSEFPFVQGLPKGEKSAVRKTLEAVKEFSALCEKHGALIPAGLVAPLLGITRQRLHVLLQTDRFPGALKFHNAWYIPEEAVVAYAKAEHVTGRPPTVKELWPIAQEIARGK